MQSHPSMVEQLDAIMDVMERAFDPAFGEAWNRNQVRDALITPNTHVIVTQDESGERASGFLLSRAAPGEEELLLLAVTPAQRRKGVASNLVAAFKDQARSRGAERLFLEVRVNNPAIRFYELCGFRQIGRRPNYYRRQDGGTLDAITFAFDL